ncbi:hypothetical protein Poly41_49170 [Novipirellula artificiosorum]|uniref:Uncharacterized protein n=2 Tax=Novipirellula artificiosorum TaxID=2528016 RepID=A0A5C6DDR2_9BACT|nr:hypothetical protein Poly41_49170 [Novipirellula artificiosorum]
MRIAWNILGNAHDARARQRLSVLLQHLAPNGEAKDEQTSDNKWVDELVSQHLSSPVPSVVEQRLKNAIGTGKTHTELSTRSHLTRRRVLVGATVAAATGMVLGVPLLPKSTPQAWGQVATRVQQKPWVHFSGVHFNGDSMELWVSFKPRVFAAKFGNTEFAHFQRASDSTSCWYRESEHLLIEDDYRPMPGEFGHLEHLFNEMTTGAPISNFSGPDEIVSQTNRVIESDGTQRWEYEFQIRAIDEGSEETYTVLFQVDPDTKLPVQWSRFKVDSSKRLTMRIDYPDSGPTSIFELGVPLDVERKQRNSEIDR